MSGERRGPPIAAGLVGGLLFGGLALAQEADPVRSGHALVTMYCADCHATEATGDSPFPTAPRFRELYLRYDVEFLVEALVEGIVTAHPEMPQFEFDPDQANAIVAYLKTLEPRSWGHPWLQAQRNAVSPTGAQVLAERQWPRAGDSAFAWLKR